MRWRNLVTELPTGTVTFLFTDIEGSTALAQQHPAELPALLARHHAILHQAIQAHNGHVFQITGDAFCAAFYLAGDALRAALDAQRALQHEPWKPAPIKVRMGIHTGAAQAGAIEERAGGYVGYLTLTRVQRVMSVAHGGQVLVSNPTAELVRGELPADVTLRDMGEHRLKGLLNPEHLWQLVATDVHQDFPPLPSLNAIPNNLPVQLTNFIGREKDIAEVKRLLSAARLVTLTGSGGAGKTRLSLQVAAEVTDEFTHGVWFVELAALTDPALIPQTVAWVLGLREEQGRPLMTMLADYVHAKTALIILDNCEHLIEGCAQFADTVLRAAPQVKILASSREALSIGGEATYRVPSLAAPDPQHVPSLEVLTQYDAVRLFIERAKAVMPSFEVNDVNAPAVAQLCYHLDGIPLALELAAARVRGLKVEQIAQRLGDRFRLLTGGGRTALPRHQTLRATIDWSHSLLTEQEQTMFRRLSVFAGGWTIEAAEAVCAGDGIELSEILGLLLRLVDKSLILMDEQSAETRYHMLETIREYAHGQLWESSEADNVQQQHLAFFLQFAEKDEPEPEADELYQWRQLLESELDNLRAALDWSFKNDVVSGLCLAGIMGRFYLGTLHEREGLDRLRKFLALPQTSSHTLERAKALLWAGSIQRSDAWGDLANTQSLLQQSRSWLEKSLAIYQEVGHQPGVADSLCELGRVTESQANWEAAREFYTDSIRTSRELGDKIRAARALNLLGQVFLFQGNRAQARHLYEEALRIYRKSGRRYAAFWPLGNLGNIALEEGDLTAARSYSEESLALYRESDEERSAIWVLLNSGEIAARQGRFDEAHAYIERSIPFNQESGSNYDRGHEFRVLALLAYFQDDYGHADELFKQSVTLLQSSKSSFPYALEGLASVAAMQGRARRAITLFGAAVALREANGTPPPPIYGEDNERGIAAARAQLNEAAFNAAWSAGQAMTQEQIIEYALRED
jgi:predicted ATPase/class 3 adenylate cyclase